MVNNRFRLNAKKITMTFVSILIIAFAGLIAMRFINDNTEEYKLRGDVGAKKIHIILSSMDEYDVQYYKVYFNSDTNIYYYEFAFTAEYTDNEEIVEISNSGLFVSNVAFSKNVGNIYMSQDLNGDYSDIYSDFLETKSKFGILHSYSDEEFENTK